MGMDIYGRAPNAPEGEYLRKSRLSWGALVDLMATLCPEETRGCGGWNYNDGDGLNADEAAALAARLGACRANSEVAGCCAGRGVGPAEKMAVAVLDRVAEALSSDGETPTIMGTRGVNAEDVDELIAFLKASGGFVVW